MQAHQQLLYRGISVALESLSIVTGNVADRPQSGRPRVTTYANDHYIIMQHLCKRRLTAAAI